MVSSSGAPLPDRTLKFSVRNTTGQEEVGIVKTERDGTFGFSGLSGIPYDLSAAVWENPVVYHRFGTVVATGGHHVDLGKIVVEVVPRPVAYVVHDRILYLANQMRLRQPPLPVISRSPLAQGKRALSIAAIVIPADQWAVHIVLDDGKVIHSKRGTNQYLSRSPLVSDDRLMAGWLAITFDVPTPTSALVQYRPGKPLRQFQGERKDGDLTPSPPDWARGLKLK